MDVFDEAEAELGCQPGELRGTFGPRFQRLERPCEPNSGRRLLTLPYSEVCMHMHIAGTQMHAEQRDNGMVQLFDGDGREFSAPITAGEAGWT